MSENENEQSFQDEGDFVHVLNILRSLEMFGGIIVNASMDDAEDTEEQVEQDRQDMTVARFGTDTEAYGFVDKSYDEYRLSVFNAEAEKAPSGHEWVSSQTYRGIKSVSTVVSKSDCGKPLTDCYDFSCKHVTVSREWTTEPDIRNEFHDSGFSLSDRPSENFWLGLPGLRSTEDIDVTIARWYYRNVLCSECHILTPKCESICQNCDNVLV